MSHDDARLELEIDEAFERMVNAATDAESREWFKKMDALLQRRSPRALMKLELERRMRNRSNL